MDELDVDFKKWWANLLVRAKKKAGDAEAANKVQNAATRSELKRGKAAPKSEVHHRFPVVKGILWPQKLYLKKLTRMQKDDDDAVACSSGGTSQEDGRRNTFPASQLGTVASDSTQRTLTVSAPSGCSQTTLSFHSAAKLETCSSPILKTPLLSGSKARVAELVVERMQQFKRVAPEQLKHSLDDSLPKAVAGGSFPDESEEQNPPENGTPDLPSTEHDGALALALQQEIKEEVPESLEEEGLFFCQICQKDLSAMNTTRRGQHVNRCLDEIEEAEISSSSKPTIPECPICGMQFQTPQNRATHLKRCAVKMAVSPKRLLQAVQLQMSTHGGAPLQYPSNQPSRSKRKGSSKEDSKQKRAKMKTKDEDLQVAMAMSRSLLEQEKREQAASVTDVKPVAALPIKWKPGPGEETTSGDTPLSGFVPPSKEKRILRSSSERFSLGLLSADFGAMVNNPHLSDVQFQVDSGEVLYAHTFVLYARCPRAVQIVHNEGFLVEEDGNAQTRRVLLSDVTEEAACAFLQYLYTADADIPARMLPQVGALAARFGVGELMAKCENSTGESQVSSGVDSEDLSEQEEKMQSINRCKNVNAAQVLSSPLIRTRDVAVQGKIEADVIVISSDDEMELEQEKKSSESGCPLKEMEIPRQPKCADVIVISSDDETELEQGPEIPKPEHNSSSVTETKQRSSQVSCGVTDAVHAADNRVTEIKDSEEERSLVSVSSGSLGDEPPIPVDDGWHAEYLSPVRGDSWNTSRVSHASASTASSPRSDFWPDRWESPVQAEGIKDSTPLRGSPRDRTTTLLHLDECASTGLFSEGSSLSGRNSKFWDDLDKEEEEEELPVMLHLIQNVSAAAGACQTEPVKTPGPACQERDKPPETPMTPMPACSTMETPELKEELSSNQPSRSKRKGSSKEDSKQKRAKMKTKDEDLQVAMAMSRSLLEQEKREQAASVTNVKPVAALPIKWKPGSEKKGRKRGPTAPPPLLLQDPETARKRIEERVATVLVEDVEFPPTPQLPTSSILEDGSGKAAWLMPLPKNKDSSLWNSSALTGPRDPELFYTAGLNPPVVPVQSSKSEIVLPSVGSDQPEVSQEVDSDLSSRDPASVEVGGQTSDESKSGPEEDGQVSFESQDVQTPQDLVELAREGLTLTQGNLDVNHVQEAEQSSVTCISARREPTHGQW